MFKVGLLLGTSLQARTALRINAAPLSRLYSQRSTYYSMSSAESPSKREKLDNPLVGDWSRQPHGLPPFHEIKTSHFESAFKLAMDEHKNDLLSIASSNEEPTFDNTIRAYDSSGKLLSRVSQTFSNLCSSNSSEELQAVEALMAGPLAAHHSSAYFTPGLFDRIKAVHAKKDSLTELGKDAVLLVDRIHLDFVRAGANFNDSQKQRYGEIVERLAVLMTQFTQNVTLDESNVFVPLAEGDLEGCPEDLVSAAKAAAKGRGKSMDTLKSGIVAPLSRSFVEPFLTTAHNRNARKKVFDVWSKRGEIVPERDNKPLAVEILKLRAEQAEMHGFSSFGAYNIADTMAKTTTAVSDLLLKVWKPAKVAALRERKALETLLEQEQGSAAAAGGEVCTVIEPWDWRYYAEKVRKQKYDFDEEKVKPFLKLEYMVEAIFDVAVKIFGVEFKEIEAHSYHEDVKIYEAIETVNGEKSVTAVLIMDPFARAYKQSGAWMSEYRSQSMCPELKQRLIPIIVCNCNFIKGSGENAPTLLSYDDAVTLFHEFGHCCHGMLSNVRFNRQAGTSVLRDFVELPSQLYEHWLLQPAVLKVHARHWQTGEAISQELVDQLKAAQKFGQGFGAVEYLSCALTDQKIHELRADQLTGLDLDDFEKSALQELEMPQGIILRHRLPHFQHLFSCSEYAAGYYVYQWAEVLDADCFAAFMELNDCFDKETAVRLRKTIYEVGSSIDPAEAFRNFRGREPSVIPMLKKKLDIDEEEARQLGLV